MAPLTLPYVQQYKDRHGKLRFYFRRRGFRAPLVGEPGTPEFLASYQSALAGSKVERVDDSSPGTIAHLVRSFYASAEWQNLKATTQREYRYRLEWLREHHGSKRVARLERRHVLQMRDERADRPGEANSFVRVLARLMSFAIDRHERTDNPAARIKLFKSGEYRHWTDAELDLFRARWPAGSLERLAFSLLLYTGQRRGDVAAMREADFTAGAVSVVQSKTGARLKIPAHPELVRELSKRRRALMMLQTPSGRAFTSESLGQFMAAAIDAAELPTGCVVHGLRKTAARMLAEAGCSEDEIMSVTGHRSATMVRLYVRGARQSTMADNAVAKWSAPAPKRLDTRKKKT